MPLANSAPLQNMTDAQFKQWVSRYWQDMSNLSPLGMGLPNLFGDGTDGDVILTSGTTQLDPYQIKQYRNLQINNGAILGCNASPAVMIIFVSQNMLVSGVLTVAHQGAAGGAGGVGGVGSPGTSNANGYCGAGGDGGAAAAGFGAGIGGSTIASHGAPGNAITEKDVAEFRLLPSKRENFILSWGAGGGGGGSATDNGGNGGQGGGGIVIFAQGLVVDTTGIITASAENGHPEVGSGADAGGGGGGGGGFIYIVTKSYSNQGSITASGGTGGAGHNAGWAGGAGTVIVEVIP